MTKIERDNGQSVQTAYEYTYTGDGIRHMKKDHLAEKEYRYGCSIDCGGTPLRVYTRDLGSQEDWNNYEDYMNSPTFVWYNHSGGGSSDTAWLPGHWMSDMEPPGEGSMFYQDAFGVQVVVGDFAPQAPMKRLPDYLADCWMTTDTVLLASLDLWEWIKGLFCRKKSKPKTPKPKPDPVYEGCLAICSAYANYCRGLPPPGSSLCQVIAKKGCQAMCRDIRDTKYFDDCATPCKGFEPMHNAWTAVQKCVREKA